MKKVFIGLLAFFAILVVTITLLSGLGWVISYLFFDLHTSGSAIIDVLMNAGRGFGYLIVALAALALIALIIVSLYELGGRVLESLDRHKTSGA